MYISINEWGDFILDDLKNGALYIGTIPSSMDNNRCSVALEDDGSVTFYIYAPNANKVEVAGRERLRKEVLSLGFCNRPE